MCIIDIIEIVLPVLASTIIVFLGFSHSRKLISIQKNTEFKSSIKKNRIDKTENLIHLLFTLDKTIQDVYNTTAFLITQTEETVELEEMINKMNNGQEMFSKMYLESKTIVSIYWNKFENDFNDYQTIHDKNLVEISNIMNGKYNKEERINNANYIQSKSRELSNNLDILIRKIITEFNKEIET